MTNVPLDAAASVTFYVASEEVTRRRVSLIVFTCEWVYYADRLTSRNVSIRLHGTPSLVFTWRVNAFIKVEVMFVVTATNDPISVPR